MFCKLIEVMTQNENIKWNAFEYEHKEKNQDWFWALGIIAVSVAGVSLMLDNILFGILILVGSFSLALFANRHPDLIQFEINKRGVVIGDTLYPYNTLDSFWIEDTSKTSIPKIIIKSKKVLMPYIIIPFEDVYSAQIHNYLSRHMKEEEHEEPLSQKILEYFGF